MLIPRDLNRMAQAQENRGAKSFLKTLKMVYAKMAVQFVNGQDLKPDQDLIKKALQAYHIAVQIETAEWQLNTLQKQNPIKAIQVGIYERLLNLIRAWVTLNTGASIKSISDTSLKVIKKLIADGQEEGFGARKIAANIRAEANGEFTKYRATVIARTEGTRAASQGAKFGAEQWEKVTGQSKWKGWSARADKRTRDSHLAMVDSNPIPGDQDFIVGGNPMDGPGDPRGGAAQCVDCRCRRVYMSERLARRIINSEKL